MAENGFDYSSLALGEKDFKGVANTPKAMEATSDLETGVLSQADFDKAGVISKDGEIQTVPLDSSVTLQENPLDGPAGKSAAPQADMTEYHQQPVTFQQDFPDVGHEMPVEQSAAATATTSKNESKGFIRDGFGAIARFVQGLGK